MLRYVWAWEASGNLAQLPNGCLISVSQFIYTSLISTHTLALKSLVSVLLSFKKGFNFVLLFFSTALLNQQFTKKIIIIRMAVPCNICPFGELQFAITITRYIFLEGLSVTGERRSQGHFAEGSLKPRFKSEQIFSQHWLKQTLISGDNLNKKS